MLPFRRAATDYRAGRVQFGGRGSCTQALSHLSHHGITPGFFLYSAETHIAFPALSFLHLFCISLPPIHSSPISRVALQQRPYWDVIVIPSVPYSASFS
eukprot:796313-Rhodomonas_salina.2